jgi:type IV pilus assembly protein PilQ
LRARAEEAERLARAAHAARQAQAAESAVKKAESQARVAADAAGVEQARTEKLRLETQALMQQAAEARAELDQARRDGKRLVLEQEAARGALRKAANEADQLAEKRAAEVRRAALATAAASRSQTMMAAAEADAKKLADTRAREVAALEAARQESAELARKKADTQRKLDGALSQAQRKLSTEEAAFAALVEKRGVEEARLKKAETALDERTATSEKLRGQAVELSQKARELTGQVTTLRSETGRLKNENAELAAENGRLSGERQKLEAQRLKLEEQTSKLAAERSSLTAQASSLEDKLVGAKKELARLESQLAAAKSKPMPITPARAATLARPVAQSRPRPSVADVRFEDDGERSRVILELSSDSAVESTLVSGEPRTVVLRLGGLSLPTALERTLDVSAYRGVVRSLTTYIDSKDPDAVRVVARLSGPGQPDGKVIRQGRELRWEFARPPAVASSFEPTKVGGYGANLPLQTAALPTVSGSPLRRKVYTGRRISLDFKDLDIHNLLRLLGDVGGVNVVISDDVKGSVTLAMKDVPWDQALDVVLKSKGLGVQKDGNLYRVAPQAVLEKEMEAELARAKAAVELKPIVTRLISASYADADKLTPRVQEMLSPRGKVSVDARTNTLILSDVAANIELAEELINRLDTPTPQVLIEARIVEATTQFTRELGIQWGGNALSSASTGNPTGLFFPSTVGVAGGAVDSATSGTNVSGLQTGAASPNYLVNLPAAVGTGSGGAIGVTFGALNGAFNINLRLSALENTGNVRIISAPKITTLDNVEASIEQGVAIPISVVSAAGTNTQFVDAKLNLTVKPHVTNEGSVIMKISLMRNEPDFVNTGARGDPTINKRQAKTEMLVKDGDTAVIGGIYTRNSGVSYNKVPWIADVPVIGWLFKNRRETDNRSELLIFITPRIINRAAMRR